MTSTPAVTGNGANPANTANNTDNGNKPNTKTTTGANVDYQSFLKLLVAQMKNQDPTEPMDATQYVAQLATFSNVEQAVQMNSKLETLIGNTSLAKAEGWIGRTLTNQDGSITGVVKSVVILKDGMVAQLEDGKTLPIGPGITVS